MRTLKTLAAFGALLLVASAANATITFNVSLASDADQAQEVDVSLTLTAGSGTAPITYGFDWLLDGGTIPLSSVELPANTTAIPAGPAVVTAANCAAADALHNQFMCGFNAVTGIGSQGSNDVGTGWAWDSPGGIPDGTYDLGRFTFTGLADGTVSIGNCGIFDVSLNSYECTGNNSVELTPIPEPTTVALIGLGLFGLALGGRRR